jgi:hypothetical protein
MVREAKVLPPHFMEIMKVGEFADLKGSDYTIFKVLAGGG